MKHSKRQIEQRGDAPRIVGDLLTDDLLARAQAATIRASVAEMQASPAHPAIAGHRTTLSVVRS